MQGICNVLPGRPRRRVDDSGGQGRLDRPEMGGQTAYHEPRHPVERPFMTQLAAIWFFALGPGTGSTTNKNTTNNNNGGGGTVPAESLPAVPASS